MPAYDHLTYLSEDAADRRLALRCATDLEAQTDVGIRVGITVLSDELYAWLRARPSIRPARLIITHGPVTVQDGENQMATQLNLQDNQNDTFSVGAVDSKGFATADGPFTWASPDDPTGQFISLVPSADTTSCAVSAVAPGQGTVQVTDPSGITGSELVVVTAGPVASLVLTAGTPASQ